MKTITLTQEELSSIVENAVKAALAAQQPTQPAAKPAAKPAKAQPIVTNELKEQVIEAIKSDPKNTQGRYYRTFAAFLIACAIKKYKNTNQIKDSTWLAAAKGYGLVGSPA